MIPFILLLLGLFFILMEFYLPGVVMGVIGIILLVSSVVVFAGEDHSPLALILFTIGMGISVVLLIKYTLRWIPRAKHFSIYLNKDQEGYMASTFDESAIGKTGVVITDLKPGGYISIDGQKHAAISQSSYIPRGSEIMVIGGQESNLIVKISKKDGIA